MQALIVSEDILYAQRLARCLNLAAVLPFSFEGTGADADSGKLEAAAFILWDLSLFDVFLLRKTQLRAARILFLSPERYFTPAEKHEALQQDSLVYKYQSYQAIQRHILRRLQEGERLCFIRQERRSRMLCVYSPLHRCGKTLLSIEIARLLGKRYKTLLLSFDGCTAQAPKEGELLCSLSDFLYRYLCYGLEPGYFYEKLQVEKGLHLIYVSTHHKDIYSLDENAYLHLFEEMAEKLNYDFIVLDMGVLGLHPAKLLEYSDVWILPFADNAQERRKLQAFQQYVQSCFGAGLMERAEYAAFREADLQEGTIRSFALDFVKRKGFWG